MTVQRTDGTARRGPRSADRRGAAAGATASPRADQPAVESGPDARPAHSAATGTAAPTGQEAQAAAASGGGARVALGVAAGATFLAFLDATVANLAVADLRGDFAGASVGGASWVITIYAIAFAALLAPAGRLADVVGPRQLLGIGVGAFTLWSLACALAPSLGLLLAARALQGAAAAVMIPASLAIVLRNAPPERRAAAIGAWSAAGALAAAAGPALGGVLVDGLGWRSVFVINVPVGLAVLAGIRAVPAAPGDGGRLPDLAGTLLLGCAVGLAALGISQGASWGWGDPRTLACLAAGIGAAAAVLWRSGRHPAPAIETALWRVPGFRGANLGSLLYGALLLPWLLLGVLFLVQVWGYSELQAGLATTPGAFAAAVGAVVAARLVARVGLRAVVAAGALSIAACGVWVIVAATGTPRFLELWLPAGLLLGLGMGAVSTGLSTAAALSVPPARFAAGTGLNQTARQIGGALGVAVLATVLTGGDGGLDTYLDVYRYCTAMAFATAIAALALSVPAPASPGALADTAATASASAARTTEAAAAAATAAPTTNVAAPERAR